jgi:hypothetical protein
MIPLKLPPKLEAQRRGVFVSSNSRIGLFIFLIVVGAIVAFLSWLR